MGGCAQASKNKIKNNVSKYLHIAFARQYVCSSYAYVRTYDALPPAGLSNESTWLPSFLRSDGPDPDSASACLSAHALIVEFESQS